MTSRNYLLDIDFLTHSPFVRWFFGHDYTATLKISILFCYHFPIWLFCDRFDEGCVCHVGYDFRSLKCIFILFVIFHVSLSFALAWLQNYENFPLGLGNFGFGWIWSDFGWFRLKKKPSHFNPNLKSDPIRSDLFRIGSNRMNLDSDRFGLNSDWAF